MPLIHSKPHARRRQPAGDFRPVIARNRCEGKGPYVAACPTAVLAMGVLSLDQRRGLSVVGRIKAWSHGYRQAVVVAPDRCEGCAACVEVCPERAITLRRNPDPATENPTS